MGRKIFDCFLYHREAYMLYLHLFTLASVIDHFVIGHSNQSFTGRVISPMSLYPFEQEIMAFSNQIVFLSITVSSLPLSKSRYRPGIAWRREATARNYLIEGVKRSDVSPDDLVLLCDVDEIATVAAIQLIRRKPPIHYYNLQGVLYFYSFRWKAGKWKRPLVIRFGAICAPLDDYKFWSYLCPLPGVLHHHCSFCFPDVREILVKLRSFSHTELSTNQFQDPNYLWARIKCGFGVVPLYRNMPEKLTLVEFDSSTISLPKDIRFDFLKNEMSFKNLDLLGINLTRVQRYLPNHCTEKLPKVE
jgi:beta-1,4-mannosyl-glycoprotein beta-1,4-N-acetylglucosaminyltransferase